jgi:hypothetical protein
LIQAVDLLELAVAGLAPCLSVPTSPTAKSMPVYAGLIIYCAVISDPHSFRLANRAVRIRLWVSYTPTGGVQRTHFGGFLHLTRP